MLLGTINFYHFEKSLLLTLTLPVIRFLQYFYRIRMKFDVVMKQFKLDILTLLLSKMFLNNCTNWCFIDCAKNFNVGMHSNVCEAILFKLVIITDIIVLNTLIVV